VRDFHSPDERRDGTEDRRDHEPDRGGDHEAGILAIEQHAGGCQRVEPEEAGAHEEGERDKKEASVAVAVGRLARREGEYAVHQRGVEDEPEVSRVVVKPDVERRLPEKETEAEEGKRDKDDPDSKGRAHPYLSLAFVVVEQMQVVRYLFHPRLSRFARRRPQAAGAARP
jgi:hypothetical protein